MPIRVKFFAAFVRRGDVRQVGGGGGEIASGDAAHKAPQEEHPQGTPQAENGITQSLTDQADQEHRAAAIVVAQLAHEWRSDELPGSINYSDHSH